MIEYILLSFITFIASYILLSVFFKKKQQEKYRLIRFQTKNAILKNEALFSKKNKQIQILKNYIKKVSHKRHAMASKNIADRHYYQKEIIEQFAYQQFLDKNKKAVDSAGSKDSTDGEGKVSFEPPPYAK